MNSLLRTGKAGSTLQGVPRLLKYTILMAFDQPGVHLARGRGCLQGVFSLGEVHQAGGIWPCLGMPYQVVPLLLMYDTYATPSMSHYCDICDLCQTCDSKLYVLYQEKLIFAKHSHYLYGFEEIRPGRRKWSGLL